VLEKQLRTLKRCADTDAIVSEINTPEDSINKLKNNDTIAQLLTA